MTSNNTSRIGTALAGVGLPAGLVVLFAALMLALAGPARAAEFGVAGFDGEVTANSAGDAYTQAGGHPFGAATTIDFNTAPDQLLGTVPVADTKDVYVDLPPGLVGNSEGIPKCTLADFYSNLQAGTDCPIESIIGVARPNIVGIGEFLVPLFNLETTPGTPATLGFDVLFQPVIATFALRSASDYGLTVKFDDISQGLPLVGAGMTIWGVPAASSHDDERCTGTTIFPGCGPNPAGVEPRPFLSLPTRCTAPGVGLETTMRMDSWEQPGQFASASFRSHLPPGRPLPPSEWGPEQGPTGCEKVPFEPRLTAQPTSHRADSPTGLEVKLSIPQDGLEGVDGIASAHLKRTELTLPEGMAVNPAAAAGLAGCSPAQIGLDSTGPANCPAASKLGDLTIETPVLEQPLHGSAYLAQQGTNPFGSTLAMYLYAEGPGLVVKLPGKIEPDERTGQLKAVFDDNPQLPFSELTLKLAGGEAAPLVNPPSCGTKTVESSLYSWAAPGQEVRTTDSFTLTSGPNGAACGARGFAPTLSVTPANVLSGASGPFGLTMSRPDGNQEFASLGVDLPAGLTAKLAGVAECGDATLASIPAQPLTGAAQNASPSCPAASRIGSATVAAGAGPLPVYVQTGKAYLAGPYKGAPLSVAVVVPALAGPFDLGTTVVRNRLVVDPDDAQVHVESDPLPTILSGIPLRLREVKIRVDRPDFMRSPTNCGAKSVVATLRSSEGASATASSRFQAFDCERLAFKPSLKLKVSGGTKRGSYTKLRAELNAPPGQANIGKASVALPHSIFLAQEHIKTICTRVQYAAKACPAASVYGWARAFTPLLEKPLEGPVYLRSSNNPLPDLVASLDGQIHIDLVGRIDSVNGGIRNTFEGVPDAPVSKFVLTMKGGRKSLLVNSTNLCAKVNRATVKLDGQNGKAHDFRPVVQSSCGKKAKKKRK